MENIATIEQATIHSFFPHEYKVENFEQLLPYMAQMGKMFLVPHSIGELNQHQFSELQMAEYSQFIGQNKILDWDLAELPIQEQPNNIYAHENTKTPKVTVDEMRCIILEILTEEGLIAGSFNPSVSND
jgi:hypothetical protein